MSTIAEFLRARYTEARERQARIFRSTWDVGAPCPACGQPTETMRTYGGSFGPLASFEPCRHAIYDPALLRQFEEPAPDPAILADLDAKLGIVARHARCGSMVGYCDDGGHGWDDVEGGGCGDLGDLALLFAAHPDYDERWRP